MTSTLFIRHVTRLGSCLLLLTHVARSVWQYYFAAKANVDSNESSIAEMRRFL